MARKKADMKCPYCEEIKAVSGMTSHVRARHPEHYEEFKKNRATLVEKYKIVEGQTAPETPPAPVETPPPAEKPAEEAPPEPKEPPAEPVEKQQSGSFLGSIRSALADW